MQIINPITSIRILGDEVLDLTNIEKRFDITKDMTEAPNEAELIVYNLNDSTRQQITELGKTYSPVEVWFTAFQSSELSLAYRGEIERVRHVPPWSKHSPGYETHIYSISQHRQHRMIPIDRKNYAKGTPKSDIVKDFTDVIGLPVHSDTIPTTGILLAQSFSGPAFPLLRDFVADFGMYTYICDGVLYISNVYDPPNPTVVRITENLLLSEPQETSRVDAMDTALHTITDSNGSVNPLRKQRRRKKRVVKKKEIGENDYVEIEAVDLVIPGIEFSMVGLPTVNPDQLVTFDGSTYYRVQVVQSYCDDRTDPPVTRIQADLFEGGATGGGFDGSAIDAQVELMELEIGLNPRGTA